MSKEYIEKEAALSGLCSECKGIAYCRVPCALYKYIDDSPPADVKPVVRGEWIWEEASWGYRCSVCQIMFDYDKTYQMFDHGFANFCPNCGAAMNEEALRIIAERNKWRDEKGEE